MNETLGSLVQGATVWGTLLQVAFILYWPFVLGGVALTTVSVSVRASDAKRGAFKGFLWGAALSFVALSALVGYQLFSHFGV